jgi:probable HAF family extracellular repeat protein
LNNHGRIVGADAQNGFIFNYHDGSFFVIPTLGAPGRSRPTAINDAGNVAGYSSTASFVNHAFLLSQSVTDLGTLPDDRESRAFGINERADVVGASYPRGGIDSHAFLFRDGQMIDLGSGIAKAINESGTIVGSFDGTHAYRYENGAVVSLGILGGNNRVSSIDINDAGQIAGRGSALDQNGNSVSHPFL